MDFIDERPDRNVLEQIIMGDSMFLEIGNEDLPIICGPCPGRIYCSPTIENSLPIYNTNFGIALKMNDFYTGWYGYTRNEIVSLPYPDLLSDEQCGICNNCLSGGDNCINVANVDYCYKSWFYYLTDLNDNNISSRTTPICSSPICSSPICSSPICSWIDSSSYCSSIGSSPDSDSIWLFH